MLRATFISIRTSTWEVTKSAGFFTFPELFQFTPLHERQHRFQYTPSLQKVFQFTPLHERRRFGCRSSRDLQNFNSRLCMRSNTMDDSAQLQGIWFQFTPLHNRQPQNSGSSPGTFPFQFTPIHERRRANGFHHAILHSISIHASTWEATLCAICTFCAIRSYFNSRLYMRGSYFSVWSSGVSSDFNSRLYMRGSLNRSASFSLFGYFNSRLYMRGSCEELEKAKMHWNFNSRLYMRGS